MLYVNICFVYDNIVMIIIINIFVSFERSYIVKYC